MSYPADHSRAQNGINMLRCLYFIAGIHKHSQNRQRKEKVTWFSTFLFFFTGLHLSGIASFPIISAFTSFQKGHRSLADDIDTLYGMFSSAPTRRRSRRYRTALWRLCILHLRRAANPNSFLLSEAPAVY